jgi:hypothetical protein
MSRHRGRAARPPDAKKPRFSRRELLAGTAMVATGGAFLWWVFRPVEPAHAETVTVWKSPTCGCCTEWVYYMRRKGYRVVVNNVPDTLPTKRSLGIPDDLHSCHTSLIGNYIVEGHVPEPAVAKLLEQRPSLKGIGLPGMPPGSPGMDGPVGIYRVFGFTAEGRTQRFADVGV